LPYNDEKDLDGMSDDKVIKIAFAISLAGHCLLLVMPRFNLDASQIQEKKEITIEMKIEKPVYLPKIDVMGKEKKIKKEVAKNQEPKEQPKEKVKPEVKLTDKTKPKA